MIGTLCALRSEKRIDLLIDAFQRVLEVKADAKLLIVGSGDMLPSLEERCRTLGIAPSCLFQPAVKDAARWMRMMDIFVLTSESESFPNGLLEAMACGCCVVASNVGGVPELVKDGVNGLIFPNRDVAGLSDRLSRVAQDEEMRVALGCAATRTGA